MEVRKVFKAVHSVVLTSNRVSEKTLAVWVCMYMCPNLGVHLLLAHPVRAQTQKSESLTDIFP